VGYARNDKIECGTGNEAFLIHSGFDLQSKCDLLGEAIYFKLFYIKKEHLNSLIIRCLGAFAVGEATASVRRTQLAVVRRKCTNSRIIRKQDSDQTRSDDT
jgi:hypothetical protein